MQSIEKLNEKIWFRFFKVVYVFFFAIALVIALGVSYEVFRPYDYSSYSGGGNYGGSWAAVFLSMTLWCIIVFLFFQLIRRAFYYVVLGKKFIDFKEEIFNIGLGRLFTLLALGLFVLISLVSEYVDENWAIVMMVVIPVSLAIYTYEWDLRHDKKFRKFWVSDEKKSVDSKSVKYDEKVVDRKVTEEMVYKKIKEAGWAIRLVGFVVCFVGIVLLSLPIGALLSGGTINVDVVSILIIVAPLALGITICFYANKLYKAKLSIGKSKKYLIVFLILFLPLFASLLGIFIIWYIASALLIIRNFFNDSKAHKERDFCNCMECDKPINSLDYECHNCGKVFWESKEAYLKYIEKHHKENI